MYRQGCWSPYVEFLVSVARLDDGEGPAPGVRELDLDPIQRLLAANQACQHRLEVKVMPLLLIAPHLTQRHTSSRHLAKCRIV